MSRRLVVVCIGLFMLISQVPFLEADPDFNISSSRGAHTDEGLYSCQIRNYINHGDLTLDKSDTLIKTPLFSGLLFLPYSIFGHSLLTGRLVVMLFSFLLLWMILSKNDYWSGFGILFLIVVFGEYHVFHFFHYCLAEIISSILIFFSLFALSENRQSNSTLLSCFIAATSISFAYYLKIQFLYALAIVPTTLILFFLIDKDKRAIWKKKLLYTSSFLILYLIVYTLFWYFPNKGFYDYVMLNHTFNRFPPPGHVISHLEYMIRNIFHGERLNHFSLLFYISFLAGTALILNKSTRPFKFLFIGISTWLFFEAHKLFMTYLPTRYIISLLFAMGTLIALVLYEAILIRTRFRYTQSLKAIPVGILLCLLFINGRNYLSSYTSRTHTIKSINEYLANYDFKQGPIVGAWAPSLSWNTDAISYPIWKNYFNDTSILKTHQPSVIITELDEGDSDQAFLSGGINVDMFADSIKYFKINNYDLKLLWIKEDTQSQP